MGSNSAEYADGDLRREWEQGSAEHIDNQAIGDGQGLVGKLGNSSAEDSPFPVPIAEPASF